LKLMKILSILVVVMMIAGFVSVPSSSAQERSTDPPTFGSQMEIISVEALNWAVEGNNYWMRYNGLRWSDYQPNSSVEFIPNPSLEQKLEDFSAAGMETILVIRSTPDWARIYAEYDCSPMTSEYIDEFADFMKQVVETYSAAPYNVKYYELWNEPDEYRGFVPDESKVNYPIGCWGESSDPYYGGGYYGEMLQAVYPKIKEADPEAEVIMGGLLLPCLPGSDAYCNMSKFFEGMLQTTNDGTGNWPYFDYVNFHGYVTYDPTDDSVIQMEENEHWWASSGGQVEGKLSYLRGIMDTYSVDKPIMLTEGALADPNDESDSDPTAYEQLKANYVMYLFARNIAEDIKSTIWYKLEEGGWNKSGLLDENNVPLPAYTAFETISTTLDGAVFQNPLDFGNGLIGYEFLKDGHTVWLLFSTDGTTKTIERPAWAVHLYDVIRRPVVEVGNTIYIDDPIYLDGTNSAPYFTSTAVVEVDQDSLYHYDITIDDPDFGDAQVITGLNIPSWLTLVDHQDGTATLSGTPGNDDVGAYIGIQLEVTDIGGLSGTQIFDITVNNVNDPPVAYPQSVLTLVNTPVTITLVADDAEGDPLTWFRGDPSNGSLSGVAPNLTYTPYADYTGSDSFIFWVEDAEYESERVEVSILIHEPSCLVVEPSSLAMTLQQDSSGMQLFSLTNLCSISVDFSLIESASLLEGFEKGIMPPAGGWETRHEGTTNNQWTIATGEIYPDYVFDGAFAAWVNWDPEKDSNEWLFTPVIDTSSQNDLSLSFMAYSDTEHPEANMLVWVTDEDYNPVEIVWDMLSEEDWSSTAYRNVLVDLSTYDGSGLIRIGWQYIGTHGQSFGLDLVEINSEMEAEWVSADPSIGTLPPSTTQEIQVLFNSTGLEKGSYIITLEIENYPYPELRVPVSLMVRGDDLYFYIPLIIR